MPSLHYLLPAGKSDLFSLMYVRVFVCLCVCPVIAEKVKAGVS